MKFVNSAVDRDRALRALESGPLDFLRKRRAPGDDSARFPYIELLYLPTYLVTIRTTSRGQEKHACCSVDGSSGSFALFQMTDSLAEDVAIVERFEPVLDEEEAERVARAQLVQTILRRRGRSGKPLVHETMKIEVVQYPYWVYYYQRGKFIDIKVLDAATGQKTGQKIRMGILDAFKRRERAGAIEARPVS